MTRSDWFLLANASELYSELTMVRADRPLYLLACAYLRRVGDILRNKWLHAAIEATEAFADGRATTTVTMHQWALAEYYYPLAVWCPNSYHLAIADYPGCGAGGHDPEEFAIRRYLLRDAAGLIDDPAWLPARAAFFARRYLRQVYGDERNPQLSEDRDTQLDLFRDLCGGPGGYERLPAWRPADPDAGRLLRAVAREEQPERAMLLALSDALEEEGGEQLLVDHLRDPMPHFRGCWAVEVLTGRVGRPPRMDRTAIEACRNGRW